MSTVIVTLCDKNYEQKAIKTINDIRAVGQWHGDLVLITVDFDINPDFRDLYRITEVKFPKIDTSYLVEEIKKHPFNDSDGRELYKLTQWEKLHVFDEFFRNWERVFFIDAGTRIFHPLQPFLELEWKETFLSHDDEAHKRVKSGFINCNQIDTGNQEVYNNLLKEFGSSLQSLYFLNSSWIYDTALLNVFNKQELIEYMNRYPICRTNEMGVMNLVINFKHKLWRSYPQHTKDGKFLYEWCEWNHTDSNGNPLNWRNFCMLKYPVTCSV